MAIRVPEGFVFVTRAPGVAAALLEAADKVGADRKADVRTVSGGYHVREAVAEEYVKNLPDGEQPAPAVPENDTSVTDVAAAQEVANGVTAGEERAYPEGAPSAEWKVKEIDAWAADQDPVIEFDASANKADKLDAIGKQSK